MGIKKIKNLDSYCQNCFQDRLLDFEFPLVMYGSAQFKVALPTQSDLYICWVNYGILFIIFLLINSEIEHFHVSLIILILKSACVLGWGFIYESWYHFAFDRLQFSFLFYVAKSRNIFICELFLYFILGKSYPIII